MDRGRFARSGKCGRDARDPVGRQLLTHGSRLQFTERSGPVREFAPGWGVRGVVVAGLIAAVMAALSAQVNSASTLFSTDIYKKIGFCFLESSS